jgi:1,4-dihydroxy-2-naphthoate octaprenyltransferase
MSVTRMFAIVAFTLVFVVIGVMEVVARRPGSKIPTLGALCGFVMRYQVGRLPVGRIAVLGFWWWLGWHVFAR